MKFIEDTIDSVIGKFRDNDMYEYKNLQKLIKNLKYIQIKNIYNFNNYEQELIDYPVYTKVLSFFNFEFKFMQNKTERNIFILQQVFEKKCIYKKKILDNIRTELNNLDKMYNTIINFRYKTCFVVFVIIIFLIFLYRKKRQV